MGLRTQEQTLVTLASRQVWPQILAVLNRRPSRLLILHSDHVVESQRPAEQLAAFFQAVGALQSDQIERACVPHNDVAALQERLEQIIGDCGEVEVHITGGNKLMAVALLDWATRRGVPALYIEQNHELYRIELRGGRMVSRAERLDPTLADGYDPLELVRCQLVESELAAEGELLELSKRCRSLPLGERRKLYSQAIGTGSTARGEEDLSQWLSIRGRRPGHRQQGEHLEYAVAFVVLSLGVLKARKGIQIRPVGKIGERDPSSVAEFDTVFVHRGRLWLVDCKDREPSNVLLENLRRHGGPREGYEEAWRRDLGRLAGELESSQQKVLKEDLLHAAEIGGKMGRVVCVRRAQPTEDLGQFAQSHGVTLVRKAELWEQLEKLLKL
ncbi:MAG: hypothetical protein N2652_11745 [Kiritimatiellae bacterium]|nr:hypothetical protein [Kiritimatiellia bacterium]